MSYRDRNPGEKVQAQNQPFKPIDDQFIYSLGLTTPIQYFNSDVVFEIFGAKAKSLSQDTDNITQIEILFDSNSDRINKIDTKMLDRFISLVKKEGFKTLVIEGHKDSIGNAEYNKDLSQR